MLHFKIEDQILHRPGTWYCSLLEDISAGCRKAILLHGEPPYPCRRPPCFYLHVNSMRPTCCASAEPIAFHMPCLVCCTLTISGSECRGQTITICPPMRHGLAGGPLRLTRSSGMVPSRRNVSMTCTYVHDVLLHSWHAFDSMPSCQICPDREHVAAHCELCVG